MHLAGYGLASLALVLFGLYMVPRKLARMSDFSFVLSMCIGVVITASLASLAVHGVPLLRVAPHLAWLAFICGPIWYLGVLLYTISVSRMGLTLATPIKNTTAVLGSLVGLIFFAEWRHTHPVPAVLGALLVVLCAVILSRTSENDASRSSINTAGVLAAVAAAVFFASYTVPFKLAQQGGLDNATLVAYMGLGTLLGAVLGMVSYGRYWGEWWRAPWSDHLYAGLTGVVWVVAILAMAGAITRIGLAITWPFTNLNMVVTVLCGVAIFHEISLHKHWRLLAAGLLVGILGVVLLGLAKY